jgi:uncharacterized protein with von Willebrand factor type A (vWA) domain
MSYLKHFIDFFYELREAGLNPFLSNIVELMKILPKVNITDLWLFKETIKAILLKEKENEPLFDYIFNKYFISFSFRGEKEEKSEEIEKLEKMDLDDPQLLKEFKREMKMNEDFLKKQEEIEERSIKEEDFDLADIDMDRKDKSKIDSMEDFISKQEELFEKEMEKKEKIGSQEIGETPQQQKEDREKQEEEQEELFEKEMEKKEKIGSQEIGETPQQQKEGKEEKHGGEEYHKEIKKGKKNLENIVNEQEKNLSQINKKKSESLDKIKQLNSNIKKVKNKLNEEEQLNNSNEKQIRNFSKKAQRLLEKIKKDLAKKLSETNLDEIDNKDLKELQKEQAFLKDLKENLQNLEEQINKKHKDYLKKKLEEEIRRSKNRAINELANPQRIKRSLKNDIRRRLEKGEKYSMKELLARINEIDDPLMNNEDFLNLLKYNLKEFNKYIYEEKQEHIKDLLEKRKKEILKGEGMDHIFSEDFSNLEKEEIDKIKRNIRKFLRRIDLKKRQVFKKAKKKKDLDIKATSRNFMKKKYEFIYRKPKFSKLKRLVFLIDVSGSIINYVPAFLLIIREFREHIKKVKYYFFVDYSIDVSPYIKKMNKRELVQLKNKYLWNEFNSYNHSYSNIGRGIITFYQQYEKDLRKDDFVLIFSDARNNFKGETGIREINELKEKVDHIYWLNPEPKREWNTGDSIMREYSRILPTHSISSFEQFFHFLTKIIEEKKR